MDLYLRVVRSGGLHLRGIRSIVFLPGAWSSGPQLHVPLVTDACYTCVRFHTTYRTDLQLIKFNDRQAYSYNSYSVVKNTLI